MPALAAAHHEVTGALDPLVDLQHALGDRGQPHHRLYRRSRLELGHRRAVEQRLVQVIS